jgi:enoyl-CoA hydratase/carnithine racemase
LTNQKYKTLKLDMPENCLAVLTLNRPAVANAFNTEMGKELRNFWTGLNEDPGELRCILVTGAGERAFCAGADLKERREMSDVDWRAQHAIFEEAFYAMMDCPVPIIAAVNGAAYGGGFEMVLASDFAYAADTARFALTETTLGIIPGVGGTQNLPRACGERRAKEIILTGLPVDAGGRITAGGAGHRPANRSQCANRGARRQGSAVTRHRPAPQAGPGCGNRVLQAHNRDPGPARRHAGLQ